MKQVVQAISGGGALRVVEVPRPVPGPTEVLVATRRSVLSPGTERSVRKLASASLLAKARSRPDLVRQVVDRARAEGVRSTMRAVRSRLDDEMPLGYCGVGVVVEVGEMVSGLAVGQRVATGSAGHAELQVVPAHLAVPVPDEVSDVEAAFATIASIALHGLRLGELQAGSRVAVVGLGLIGQLALRLAHAAGCDPVGLDLRAGAVDFAQRSGAFALVDNGEDATRAVLEWSRGAGVDAVILTAATASSEPVRRAAAIARDRAIVVVVGDVGLELQRTPYYDKELTLRLARSYGPGRYDRSYEEWAVDYPIGQVRWTEGRNLESYLSLLRGGQLHTADLVSHEFAFDQVLDAYGVIERGEDALGIQLVYASDEPDRRTSVDVAPRRRGGRAIGLLGAGGYARSMLVPAFRAAGFTDLAVVASEGGLSARRLAEKEAFARAASRPSEVIDDPTVDIVAIATRHDSHADLATRALKAGKHVFCEKPLALSDVELEAVVKAWRPSGRQLTVGFNRRWSPAVSELQRLFGAAGGPLVATYRVNAGRLDAKHWYHDRRQGGRLLGEVCHFIDTCNAVVGSPVASVVAFGTGHEEAILAEDLVVTLRYEDGSAATISYAAGGHSSTPKERLEVLGRGHSAVVDDFRRTTLDGKTAKSRGQDKGHHELVRRFKDAVETGEGGELLTSTAIETSAVTLAAVQSLLTGSTVTPTRY